MTSLVLHIAPPHLSTHATHSPLRPNPTPPHHTTHAAVEEQLALVTSSGRPFELIDVRVVGEDGADVAKGSGQVGAVLAGLSG